MIGIIIYFIFVIGILTVTFSLAYKTVDGQTIKREDIEKELVLWMSICCCLLFINGMFFLPTDGFGDYITVGEIEDYDIDIQCFIIQTIGIVSVCFIGYLIHKNSNNYNNPYIQNISNNQIKTSNNIEEKKTRIVNNYDNIQSSNIYALISFICGILGYCFTTLSILLGLVSIILGIVGIITFDYSIQKNKWFAIVGIVLGIFCIIRHFVFFSSVQYLLG